MSKSKDYYDFEKELRKLLQKYGYEGVMYNIRLNNMRSMNRPFDIHKDVEANEGGKEVCVTNNHFNGKEA